MKFYVIFSVSLIVLLFASKTLADKSVTFDITRNGQDMRNCNTSDVTLDVVRNETIDVYVLGYTLHYSSCSVVGDRTTTVLGSDNFVHHNQSHNLAKVNTANLKSGRWNCTFLILKNIKKEVMKSQLYTYSNDTYTRVSCTVRVNVLDPIMNPNMIYYIAGGCAIGLIVIAQFVIIIYLKRKSVNSTKLKHIQRTPTLQRDDARYSVGPGQRKNSRKDRDEDLYDTVDELLQAPKSPTSVDITKRPPMPLPTELDSSDDDHIYKGGTTLNKMFSPEPPPLETLPRNRGKKNGPKPKPAPKPKPSNSRAMKPPEMELEDYDYADNNEMSNTDSLSRALIKGRKPVPKLPKKIIPNPQRAPHLSVGKPLVPAIPGGALLMNELSNKLGNDMKMKNIANPNRHMAERVPYVPIAEAGWQQGPARGKAREMTPPDARVGRSPQSYRPPDQRTRPPGAPPHALAPARGPPLGTNSPDVPRGNNRAPMAMVSPMQLMPVKLAPPPVCGTKPNLPVKFGTSIKPLQPPPQTEELYEPVDEPDDTQNNSDDEFDKEDELEPYNMYINSVSVQNQRQQY